MTDETVDALVALGVDEPTARRAVEQGRVPLLLVRQLIGEDRRYTLDEVADQADLDPDILERVYRALGAPLQDRYGDADVEEARQIAATLEVFTEDALVRLARVRGMSVSRIAMGDVNAVRDELVAPMRQQGADDLAVAVSLAEAAKALLPVSGDLLVHAHRRALVSVLSSELATAAARESEPELDLAIGFVDLVGYTSLSVRVDPTGLEAVLEAFEERVLDVAGVVEDVTLVKFLGDAAMFVATDPVELAGVLVTLAQPFDSLEEAPLRAGMAAGPTLAREGDYYGPAVNMAARLTDHARPWTVLADDQLADRLEDQFATTRIRPTRLRGIGLRRPLSVKPSD